MDVKITRGTTTRGRVVEHASARVGRIPPTAWALAMVAVTSGTGWAHWVHHPGQWVGAVLVVTLLAWLGGTYVRSRHGRRMGLHFLAAAVFESLTWAAASSWPIGPVVGEVTHDLFLLALFAGVLLFEQPRYGSWLERAWIMHAAVTMVAAQSLMYCLVSPEQAGYAATSIWPSPVSAHRDLTQINMLLDWSYLALAATFVIAATRRWRQLHPGDRRRAVPLWASSGLLATLTALVEGSYSSLGADRERHLLGWVLEAMLATGVPLSLFAAGAWARRHEARTLRRVAEECTGVSLADTEDSLARILDAPGSVRFWLWLPGVQRYVTRSGRLHAADEVGTTGEVRVAPTPLPRPDGGPALGYARLPTTTSVHQHVMTGAVEAVAPVLRALQYELDTQEVIRAAQVRALDAEHAGRREVARDLHDGLQQRLLALSVELARASSAATLQQRVAIVDRARAHVDSALDDVGRLAQGLHPHHLRELGLAAALRELTDDLGLRADLQLHGDGLPPALEHELYRALCEGVINCHKHAGSDVVRVRVWRSSGQVHGEVSDEGAGGARIRLGGGLHGVQDRVVALGGRLQVAHRAGGGTVMQVHLPCRVTPAGPT